MHFFGGTNHSAEICFKRIGKDKEKYRADVDLDRQKTEFTPRKYFKCGYVDNLIAKCLKPPKNNEK